MGAVGPDGRVRATGRATMAPYRQRVEGCVDGQDWAAPDAPASPGPTLPAPAGPAPVAPAGRPVRLPVPLRPMTASDLLDGSFAVIKARPRTVFAIAAAVLVPFHLVAAFLQRDLAAGVSLTSGLARTNSSASAGTLGLSYLALAVLSLAPFFLGGALARLVTTWYVGGDLSAGDALRATARRAPALVGAFALLLPLKILGGMVMCVGAIPVVTLFVVTAPAITVEGLGPIAGAQRSWRLVSRRFWPSLLLIVLATVAASVLGSIFGGIPQQLVGLLPAPFDWLAKGVVAALVALVVDTALASVAVLLYVDLRIRTEGLDLELGAADAIAR
jgi:hypothetical protein